MTARSTGNNLDAVLNFVPTLAPSTLIEGYRQLVKDLYSPRVYYQRVLTFLAEYHPTGPRGRTHLSDAFALLRSLWVIGVASPGRWEFWKFLARTLRSHRSAFHEALELAIRGYHFRVVADGL